MRGKLQLQGPEGPVELSARVVEYRFENSSRYSWHGPLESYQGQAGQLVCEGGASVEVVVNGVFLDAQPATESLR